jgi:ABC-type Zn uptake system ZnuABC Zn-binding protein ZnuA
MSELLQEENPMAKRKDRLSDHMTRFLYFLARDHLLPKEIESVCDKADMPDDHYGFDPHLMAYAKNLADTLREKDGEKS